MHTRRMMGALVVAAGVGLAASTGATGQVTIGANFTTSTRGVDSNFIPPDTMGTVGVDHYVELINGRYSVFRKADGVRVQTSTLHQFFIDSGVSTSSSFDPRILYDPYSKRWFALGADNSSSAASSYLLAVSKSADPTLGWSGFRIDADPTNNNWVDFPMLGLNGNTVVLTGNNFAITGVGTTTFVSTVVVPKSDLLLAVPTVANRTNFSQVNPNNTGFALHPIFDLQNGTAPLQLLSDYNTPAGVIKGTRITGTPAAPTIDTSAALTSVVAANAPPTADQPGAKANIHTGDNRFQSHPVLVNNELWVTQSVESGGRAAIRWYRLNATTFAIIEQGTITHPTLDLMRPTITANHLGDVVLGLSATSPTQFVSTYFITGKTVAGTTTFGSPQLSATGLSDYQRLDSINRNRWGDYSAIDVDPTDPSIFWTIQEFVSSADNWSDRATEIIVPLAGEQRWRNNANGNFNTAANWISGAVPGAADHVIYSRPTVGVVGYTVTNPAGTTTNSRLSLRQGSMTINLGGGTQVITSTSTTAPGVTIAEYAGTPSMILTNGTLSSVNAAIGYGTLSTSTVLLNVATWNNSAGLAVGGRPPGAGGSGQAGGVASLTLGSGAINVGGVLKVWNAGTVSWFGGTITAGTLDVQGGRFFDSANGTRLLKVGAVTTSAGGIVDLNDNDMQVQGNSSYAQVRPQIVSARNGGLWNGSGITSTAAANNGLHNTTLGMVTGTQYLSVYGPGAVFDGSPVAANNVLVKYTYYGDTDLNGIINFDDYGRTDNGFNSGGTDWFRGDFDYSGGVNFDDYSLIDLAFNTQSGTLRLAIAGVQSGDFTGRGMDAPAVQMVAEHLAFFGGAYATSFLSAVPEPGTLAGLMFCAGAMGMRRRQNGARSVTRGRLC
ncbi:hypothetical protein BH09PLA1_BH09PLA1_18200 [soil metagenome]